MAGKKMNASVGYFNDSMLAILKKGEAKSKSAAKKPAAKKPAAKTTKK